MFLSSCLGVLFAGSPFFTSLGGTPRPIAFRLRGQDPCVDLGPGWFAMGPGVCLRVTFLFFFFGFVFPSSVCPASAVAFAALLSSSVFLWRCVFLFPLVLLLCCRIG